MTREEILQELCLDTDSKILLLVIDGLGDLPVNRATPLEAARTPHLDRIAKKSSCGLSVPVFPGITPGSGPAHLALFGYDPTTCLLGRGILEALGLGVDAGPDDVVARGNFATLKNGLIADRRAGRIPTEENEKLCQKINGQLKRIEEVRFQLYPGKEHRFVVKLSGKGLSDTLLDADPQKNHMPRIYTRALTTEAEKTARVVNAFLDKVTELLQGNAKASTVLLRGFSRRPFLPSLKERFKLKSAALASYPMYKGLASLVGMDVLDAGQEIQEQFSAAEKHFSLYNFFYIHCKKPDAAGEDGHFQAKKEAIEEIDCFIPLLEALKPEVFVVTSDHSTPCLLKSHSWHPNPFLIHSSSCLPDKAALFSERECAQGYLGHFPATDAMPLMLAHAGKLKKFGA